VKKRGFPGQHETEDVLLVFHQHPLVMRKAFIIGSVGLIAGLLPWSTWPTVPLTGKIVQITLVLLALYWFWHAVGWYYTVYILTNERLIEIKQRGFFNRKVSEYGLDKIQNFNYHIKGLQAVMFQYGDITAQTYTGDMVMKQIFKPVEIHAKIIAIWRKVNSTNPDF
jgi:uncharacterized membrane protein YdbT with pleckstrin-like domain